MLSRPALRAPTKPPEAIVEWRQGRKCRSSAEVPFTSALKWSALAFDGAANGMQQGVRAGRTRDVAGTSDHRRRSPPAEVQVWSGAGLRVLVFAGAPDSMTLHGAQGEPACRRCRF